MLYFAAVDAATRIPLEGVRWNTRHLYEHHVILHRMSQYISDRKSIYSGSLLDVHHVFVTP